MAADSRAILANIYASELGRDPDPEGLNFYIQQLQSGKTPDQIRAEISGSAEGIAFDARTPSGVLQSLYEQELGRAADPGGLNFYSNLINEGATAEEVRQALNASDEGRTFDLQSVNRAYQDQLGRAADPAGTQFYLDLIQKGYSQEDIEQMLNNSEEGKTFDLNTLMSSYQSVLGRPIDAAGREYWLSRMGQDTSLDPRTINAFIEGGRSGTDVRSTTTGGTGTGGTTRPVTVLPGAGVEEQIATGALPQRVMIGGAPVNLSGGFAAYPYNTQALAEQLYAPAQRLQDIAAAAQMPPGLVAPPNMQGVRTPGFTPFTSTPVTPFYNAPIYGGPAAPGGGVKIDLPTTPTTPINPTIPVTPGTPQNPLPTTPTQNANSLFQLYATGFTPDQAALDFWNGRIAAVGYEKAMNEFLNPTDYMSPRVKTMFTDPDYLSSTKGGPAGNLFSIYATGYAPDQAALDFWNSRIATVGYDAAVNEFLNPQDLNAPRVNTMFGDPDYIARMGNRRTTTTTPTTTPTTGGVTVTPTTTTTTTPTTTTPTTTTPTTTTPTTTPISETGPSTVSSNVMTRGPLPAFLEPIATETTIYDPETARELSGQGISSTMTDIGQALSSYGEMPYLPGGLGMKVIGNIITGQQAEAMGDAAEKLRTIQQNPLPGTQTISDVNGNVYTVSNPQTIEQADRDMFGDNGTITAPTPGGPSVTDDIPRDDDLGVNFLGFAQGGYVQAPSGIGTLPMRVLVGYDQYGNPIYR
jgi:hypothetical protein